MHDEAAIDAGEGKILVVKSLVVKYLENVPVSWLTEFLEKIACMKANA